MDKMEAVSNFVHFHGLNCKNHVVRLFLVTWGPTITLFLPPCLAISILFSLVHLKNHSTSIFVALVVLEFYFSDTKSQNDAFVTFYFHYFIKTEVL